MQGICVSKSNIKDAINWLDEQQGRANLDEKTKAELKRMQDQLSETIRHNKVMENKPRGGSGKVAKEDKPIVIQTKEKI